MLGSSSCDDSDRSCTGAECGSPGTFVLLRDDAGAPVLARGERRVSRGADIGVPQPFDCRSTPDAGQPTCSEGSLPLFEFNLSPSLVYELRFTRADGSFTPWQAVPLELEQVTDPDFNGPGCACSWYKAEPASVIVPADAR